LGAWKSADAIIGKIFLMRLSLGRKNDNRL